MKKIALHWQILAGIILAVILGSLYPESYKYFSWLGTLFLNGLKMVVVPLVFSSLFCGITNNTKGLGRLGIKTMVYYMSTSLLAILTGLILVNSFHPGIGLGSLLTKTMEHPDVSPKPITDTITGIVPSNIFHAFTDNKAMLSIIFIAILAGVFTNTLESNHRNILINFFQAFFELMMKITLFIMRFAPIGVFGLIIVVVAQHHNFGELLLSLGKYALTVVSGLVIHMLITLPLILLLIGKVNPIKHYKAMLPVLITAFSTSSSSATLPVTMETVEKKAGVSNRISSFMLPLGATINMDGTALYELVVAGFVAQLYGIHLTFGQQFIMVFTALLASIGTAAIPMASLVTMTIIFSAINLPFAAVALVLPLDRPLDMLRTTVNVFSDTCGSVTVASSEGEDVAVRL